MRAPANETELHAAEHEVAEAAVAAYEAEVNEQAVSERLIAGAIRIAEYDVAATHLGNAWRRFDAAVTAYAAIRPEKDQP